MSPEEKIISLIEKKGGITFADFMDIAMFWPRGGYYASGDPWGVSGDYYTSPMVHPAFSAMLCIQLFQMWDLLHRPDPFYVVELGFGNGMLRKGILSYSEHLPNAFLMSLQYLCIDRHIRTNVIEQVNSDLLISDGVPLSQIKGCFLSNELIDSFPVHRIMVENGELSELYVTHRAGILGEELGELSDFRLKQRFDDLGITLLEGQVAEINLGLGPWIKEVAQSLQQGFVWTTDYGDLSDLLYSSEKRFRGTLTTYSKHIQTDSPFDAIGRQDITSYVDFTTLMREGMQSDLHPEFYSSQRRLLLNLGYEEFSLKMRRARLPFNEERNNRYGLRDLVNPDGLGNFKTLIQSKGLVNPLLWASKPTTELNSFIANLPFPKMESEHLPLYDARYPGQWSDSLIDDLLNGENAT